MAVPKRRQTSGRGRRRRGGHSSLQRVSLIACTNCEQKIPAHQVCPNCGHYKDKNLVS